MGLEVEVERFLRAVVYASAKSENQVARLWCVNTSLSGGRLHSIAKYTPFRPVGFV